LWLCFVGVVWFWWVSPSIVPCPELPGNPGPATGVRTFAALVHDPRILRSARGRGGDAPSAPRGAGDGADAGRAVDRHAAQRSAHEGVLGRRLYEAASRARCCRRSGDVAHVLDRCIRAIRGHLAAPLHHAASACPRPGRLEIGGRSHEPGVGPRLLEPQPSICARCARSDVSLDVGAADRSTPTSFIAVATSACTREPGSVPAEMARALVGSANRLNQAAAICDRPALWTQAKRTVFMMPTSLSEASRRVQRFVVTPARATETTASQPRRLQTAQRQIQARRPDECRRRYPSALALG
jgi:hypothetical protein